MLLNIPAWRAEPLVLRRALRAIRRLSVGLLAVESTCLVQNSQAEATYIDLDKKK